MNGGAAAAFPGAGVRILVLCLAALAGSSFAARGREAGVPAADAMPDGRATQASSPGADDRPAGSTDDPAATLTTSFGASSIAIGEALEVSIAAPEGATAEALPPLTDADVAPFTLLDGAWARDADGNVRWTGRVTVFDLGTFTFPAWTAPEGSRSEERSIEVVGRLTEEEVSDPASLADLKPPAAIAPRWTPWAWALGGLAALVLAAWIWRRIRSRLAERLRSAPVVTDPFDRLPPHEWAYRELKALLATRWAERGEIDRFHTRLSWIVRRYLGGRYRLELMESTTPEIGPALRSAGAAPELLERMRPLLERLDAVKFARAPADVEACRRAVEDAYRLIDASRPDTAPPVPDGSATPPPAADGAAP